VARTITALVVIGTALDGGAFVTPPRASFRAPAAPQRWPAGQRAASGQDFEILQDSLTSYTDLLKTDPIPTKFATAAILAAIGDGVSQSTEEDTPYDWLRGLSFAAFGGLYTGTFQHWWFMVLGEMVPAPPADDLVMRVSTAALQTGLCQFGTIPLIYLPIFFLITGALRGFSVEQALERARMLYLPLWQRNVGFWIPVQMAQFLFIEPEWQVPYCCVAGLIWNVILSKLAGPLQVDPQAEQESKELLVSTEQPRPAPVQD